MESARQTWNDERMDEFAARTEENFREVRVEIRGLRTELRGVEVGLRTEMNERFAGLERRLDVIVGAMAGGFVSLLVAIVGAHFLG
ncbi:MAG TPA: hypothetical protein VMH33_13525 [Solirubrobacterales bacterium]|nr:hypothetical protein [Solirubrobacterales bacterium]